MRTPLWTSSFVMLLWATLAAADARADTPEELVLEEVEDPAIEEPYVAFAQGTWSVAAYGGWIGGDSTDIAHGHFAVAFHPLERFAVALEGGVYDIANGNGNSPAGSIDVVLRYYLIHHEWLGVFLDVGAGVMVGGTDLPLGTSWWNFTPQARAGAAFEITPHAHLIAAGGWWHASTAGLEQPNPGYNGAQVWAGLMVTP